jgi:hypothetical protein
MYFPHVKQIILPVRPRLELLHFTIEAVIFFCFSSKNNCIGRTGAVLINCLTKQLYMESFLKHALMKPHEGLPRRDETSILAPPLTYPLE